ncbi:MULTISPECIES: ABC transporter ATP-binding protein [Clostridia]|uniref:ABC transporter ATP-binding protein n=1 Tax=Clostridia TaxID=186801 RepID=UPI000EA2BA94|nr:ABC transporter ATP-binding protein [Clostridium sp. 1xD42-85]NBJ69948.1 ABC transporter ATP-binding protein [Roseburia sp. 1XD42-34]RKI77520.1 ABC transporter ATP-binding protein [Clostridium sp. 1xD42-85]
MKHAVEMKNVTKKYKKNVVALNNLTLKLTEGKISSLLGPNGSGKSTTIRMLTSLAYPDEGEILIFGNKKIDKHLIGCVSQSSGVDPMGTGRENLMLQGRIYGLKGKKLKERVDELLRVFHLQEDAGRLSKNYSGGMRRKLDLAMGIIHRPKLLFLDEPTTGLDPEARKELWNTIKRLQHTDGMTVILTTHYMEEADELSDWIAFINDGTIVAEGTAEELKSKVGKDTVTIMCNKQAQAYSILQASYQTLEDKDQLLVMVEEGEQKLAGILEKLRGNQINVSSVTVSKPDLGDVYLLYTGKKLSVEVGAE